MNEERVIVPFYYANYNKQNYTAELQQQADRGGYVLTQKVVAIHLGNDGSGLGLGLRRLRADEHGEGESWSTVGELVRPTEPAVSVLRRALYCDYGQKGDIDIQYLVSIVGNGRGINHIGDYQPKTYVHWYVLRTDGDVDLDSRRISEFCWLHSCEDVRKKLATMPVFERKSFLFAISCFGKLQGDVWMEGQQLLSPLIT